MVVFSKIFTNLSYIYSPKRDIIMVQPGQKYRHYKSTDESNYHTYEIVAVGIFQGDKAYDMEEVVIYKPLYTIASLPSHVSMLVRPLTEFESMMDREGKTLKRFTLIG